MTTTPLSTQTSIPTVSTTPPATQTQLVPERPMQRRFNDDEQGFLRTYLTAYRDFYQSVTKQGAGKRGIKGSKGKKKQWVLDNAYPAFAKHFNSAGPNGPNIASLKEVSTLLSAMFIR